MAYPTGSGSEILWRTSIGALSGTETAFRFDGTNATTGTDSYTVPALHIITVISISIHNVGTDTETFSLKSNQAVAGDIHLLQEESIAPKSTFIWNDRFVLVGGDALQCIVPTSPGNLDLHLSYIDQDWT